MDPLGSSPRRALSIWPVAVLAAVAAYGWALVPEPSPVAGTAVAPAVFEQGWRGEPDQEHAGIGHTLAPRHMRRREAAFEAEAPGRLPLDPTTYAPSRWNALRYPSPPAAAAMRAPAAALPAGIAPAGRFTAHRTAVPPPALG